MANVNIEAGPRVGAVLRPHIALLPRTHEHLDLRHGAFQCLNRSTVVYALR
jgi:hypothetical protein